MKYPYDYINKVICGDCLEVMKNIPDNSIDLVLTDPPYGIGADKGVGGGSKRGAVNKFEGEWDKKIPDKKVFDEIFRVSKNQIIFGGNYFVEYLHNSSCWLVWDKRESLPQRTFADAELLWTSFKSPVRIYRYKWDGMIQQDMKNKDYKWHPTLKPVKLIEKILLDYSEEKQTILDPFLGSGTTAVACQNLHRNFIGIEISPEYCKIAEERLRQKPLF